MHLGAEMEGKEKTDENGEEEVPGGWRMGGQGLGEGAGGRLMVESWSK